MKPEVVAQGVLASSEKSSSTLWPDWNRFWNNFLRSSRIKKLAIHVNALMSLAGGSGKPIGGPKRNGFVMHGLQMLPTTEPVMHLNVDFVHTVGSVGCVAA